MTPQERRVMDNLVTAVDFLLSDTPRSGRHNEVKAIRETLLEVNADLKNASIVKPGDVSMKWSCNCCEFTTHLDGEMTMHARIHF